MLKKGDKVKIISGPASKIGKIGIVQYEVMNGVSVKLGNDLFTFVKFEHLEKIKGRAPERVKTKK